MSNPTASKSRANEKHRLIEIRDFLWCPRWGSPSFSPRLRLNAQLHSEFGPMQPDEPPHFERYRPYRPLHGPPQIAASPKPPNDMVSQRLPGNRFQDQHQGDKGNVNADGRDLFTKNFRIPGSNVDALQTNHALVLAQAVDQLIVSNIDGEDFLRTSLQKTIRKTTRGSAYVEANLDL